MKRQGFGSMAVFLTSISSILGAILFLRLGEAVGSVGLTGVLLIIIIGHLVTMPTAMAISELATNTRVEGGGEYFIISRSLGPKLGFTIGTTLFLSQTISIAFYIIAFSQVFIPIADWAGYIIDTRIISLPTLIIIAWIIMRKGAGSGMKMLYIITAILIASLVMFFFGDAMEVGGVAFTGKGNFGFKTDGDFFKIFAICFPAFTGITAGVGLSGDLRNPGKAIPIGTLLGTAVGFVVYILVSWKLAVSAPSEALTNQLVMANIAIGGMFVILPGLAASTLSSAIGAMMVAPRTLQAIAADGLFPVRRVNKVFKKGKGETNEPNNATFVSFVIAAIFVVMGDVNSVAQIISMFFLITYGSLCLCSFLNHFGAPPSYRPRFHSRWYISLVGFLVSVWVMFKINAAYTIISYAIIVLLYLLVEYTNRDKRGLADIFRGTLFQINRHIQLFLQKNQAKAEIAHTAQQSEWRPSTICLSQHTFERRLPLDLMRWISYRHGFGTYTHFIEGDMTAENLAEAADRRLSLVKIQSQTRSALFVDTLIAPDYNEALAQMIQQPSISGMENNLVLFEWDKHRVEELNRFSDRFSIARRAGLDIAVLGCSDNLSESKDGGIHVWINDAEHPNTNFMILLGYIILTHPDWRRSHIKLLIPDLVGDRVNMHKAISERISSGRLPITLANIEIVPHVEHQTLADLISDNSRDAALTIVGFDETTPIEFFASIPLHGDTLLVSSMTEKEIG